MNFRIEREKFERIYLSPYAACSKNSKGRTKEEIPCDIRTAFQRDRDRILHCKSFRRLKHKTQVFIAPEGDHYRTRLTHTLEVSQIGRTIARALKLNEDLTEAIALGHDLGHTPFGHAGEEALNEISPLGFKHYEQSLRVVEKLEKKGRGLNLTSEVKNGIVNHPTSRMPNTLEGKIIRFADKIAYINHDIDDAIRGKILDDFSLPKEYLDVLGHTFRERINKMIHDLVENSYNQPDIIMSKEIEDAMLGLRQFMFKNVYIASLAKNQEGKAKAMLQNLYIYFIKNIEKLPEEYCRMIKTQNESKEQVVCDYIAGMTDQFAIKKYRELFIPTSWNIY